jgi:hypothetical protein
MDNDTSIREHKHIQMTKATFHHESLAPILQSKGGSGKARFTVEPMVYITGVGFEQVDPMAKGNEFMIGFLKYVEMMEIMGYEHTGRTSEQIRQYMENIWDCKEKDW